MKHDVNMMDSTRWSLEPWYSVCNQPQLILMIDPTRNNVGLSTWTSSELSGISLLHSSYYIVLDSIGTGQPLSFLVSYISLASSCFPPQFFPYERLRWVKLYFFLRHDILQYSSYCPTGIYYLNTSLSLTNDWAIVQQITHSSQLNSSAGLGGYEEERVGRHIWGSADVYP